MRFLKPLTLVLMTLVTTTAGAALTGASLQAAIQPPADVRLDVTENDNGIRGMDEAQTISVTETPDFGVPVSWGTDYIDCHLLHFDPVNELTTVTGRFRFDGEIIGVITESATLDTWDALCDPGPPMAYPTPGDELLRGLETHALSADAVRVVQSPGGAWNRIEVTAEVTGFTDQVRVITCRDTSPMSCHQLADSIGWDDVVMP